MFFRFRKTRQPQAGAEAYSFLPSTHNPGFSLFTGPGVAVLPPFSPVQPSPMYYPSPLSSTAGLGGLIYTTNYFTPLMQSTKR